MLVTHHLTFHYSRISRIVDFVVVDDDVAVVDDDVDDDFVAVEYHCSMISRIVVADGLQQVGQAHELTHWLAHGLVVDDVVEEDVVVVDDDVVGIEYVDCHYSCH